MIEHLLVDTVVYSAPTGARSGGGQATYGAQQTIKGRWEERSTKITDAEGVERLGSHVVAAEVEIPTNSRVWGPDDDTAVVNDARLVIGRRKASTPGGWTLYETVLA